MWGAPYEKQYGGLIINYTVLAGRDLGFLAPKAYTGWRPFKKRKKYINNIKSGAFPKTLGRRHAN